MRTIIFTLCIALLSSCAKESFTDSENTVKPPITAEESTITFQPSAYEIKNDSTINTKSMVLLGQFESKIWNYNIYCFCRSTGEVRRIYSENETPKSLLLSNGVWDIFAFANTDRDMGKMSRYEVDNYTYKITQTNDLIKNYRLLMVHQSSVSVYGDRNISLEMERLVARFEVDINFIGEAKDYTLIKTEVFNGALSCKVFDNGTSILNGVNFENHKNGTMTFYVLENLQGTRHNITRPEDKNNKNAPTNATYIRITAESETHSIKYDYYLGSNTTSDFNVRRNTKYNININITGQNTSDWRVTSTLLASSMTVYNKHLDVYGSGNHGTWAFEFKAGNKKEIKVEFFADIDNNEFETTYIAMFFEEEHYDKYFMQDGYLDYLLFRSKYGDPCFLANFDEGEGGLGQRYAIAKVKPNVRYRLVILCHQVAGQPSSDNDIRVYMEKGTEQEVFKDMSFSVYP